MINIHTLIYQNSNEILQGNEKRFTLIKNLHGHDIDIEVIGLIYRIHITCLTSFYRI